MIQALIEMFLFGLMVYMFISLFVNHKWITKRQKLTFFALFAVIIYCSNVMPSRLIPLKLERVGTYSVVGKHIGFIQNNTDKRVYKIDYEILVDKDIIKITKGQERNELIASFKLPGEIISINHSYAIYKLNNKNVLIGFGVDEVKNGIFEFKIRFEKEVDASKIIWSEMNPIVTQSDDKKTLYYFDTSNGNLKYKKQYKKPVNFAYFREYGYLCVGYDGENLIYQEMPDSGIAEDKFFKMPVKLDSIDKSFFQLVRYLDHIQDYDFFDGKYLWRCSLNSDGGVEISKPLEIEEPGIGYILGPYPYRDGTCIVYGRYENLTISKIDTKKWNPLVANYQRSIYGYLEDNYYHVRLFEQREIKGEHRYGSHYYNDVLIDGKPLPASQEIIEAYELFNSDNYPYLYYLFSKDTMYRLKDTY